MTRSFLLFILISLVLAPALPAAAQGGSDTPYLAPVSLQYPAAAATGAVLQKVVVDQDGNPHVLTDEGMLRLEGGELVPDLLYRPLAGKRPLDVTASDVTGNLYYLYDSCFLSNAEAGMHGRALPPGLYDHIAVAASGEVLVTGHGRVTLYRDGRARPVAFDGGPVRCVKTSRDVFYLATDSAVYSLSNDGVRPLCRASGLRDFLPGKGVLYLCSRDAYWALSARTGDTALSLHMALPATGLTCLASARGDLWAATARGAFRERAPGRYDYFASRRWLDTDSIVSMAADRTGNVYLLSASGLNEIRFQDETLHGKALYFERLIRRRHIRYGLLSETRMKTPGDPATAEMIDTDNDGLWSSFYVGSEALRYAVTGSPEARRNAWETFGAFERLVALPSVTGLPARTFERSGYKVSDPGAWRPSPDSGWEWKGTTSSDEFVGHIFAAAMMDEFVARTPAEKKRVAAFIDAILTHIITHGYNFVDTDGEPTLWGRWSPDYINGYPRTIGDRKLGSTTIVAGLELGYRLTQKALYKNEALRLLHQEGYLDNILIDLGTIRTTPGKIYRGHDMGAGGANHSDDEMTFLAYWVLYHYALDSTLRRDFSRAITNYWTVLRPEKNALWNLIALGTSGSIDTDATWWYLRGYPLDQIRWTVRNSGRGDLHHLAPNFRERYTEELLSPREQPLHRDNANPFTLDGGNGGRTELTGAEFLLPYWLGRHLGVIAKPGTDPCMLTPSTAKLNL
jgi:hypothetical protein